MKKLIKSIAAVCLSAGMCFAFSACGGKNTDKIVSPDQSASHSIMTKLDLSVTFDGDTAIATVKNSFTLFPAKARVFVYLYYSENHTDDYTEMLEVAQNFVEDLDMGKTLTASYDTKGRGGYFLARMRYKIDSRKWEERVTGVYEREYTKVILEPIEDDGSLPVFENIEPVFADSPILNDYKRIYEDELFHVGWLENEQSIEEFENKSIKQFNETIGKKFYILNPADEEYNALMNWVDYSIYEKDDGYLLRKHLLLYAPEFGYPPPATIPPDPTGLGVWNLGISIFTVNIENIDLKGKFKIQFGRYEKSDNIKFINLYIAEFCIGTCYYTTDTLEEIPYAFFYNLFVEGLRIL